MLERYSSSTTLREYLLSGAKITTLEALLLFGVQTLSAELTRMKQEGFIIKKNKISMAKIITRINQFTVCKPPENLPYKEITMTEYWISF